MAQFLPAFNYMIRNEDASESGVVTPEPNGGQARLGINSVSNPAAVTDGFYTMALPDAIAYAQKLYKANYWDPHGFDGVNSQQIASKLFDVAVNMGNGAEHIELVQAIMKVLKATTFPISASILELLNACNVPLFLSSLVTVLQQHYQDIFNSNPTKYANCLKGWLARASKMPPADPPTITNPAGI